MSSKEEAPFGNQNVVKTVVQQHRTFVEHLPALRKTINSFFLGAHQVNRAQDMAHLLCGIVCKHLFEANLLLAFNGYVASASSLLRTMTEHTINAAYLHRKPEEVENFIDWSYKREKDLVESILSLEDEWVKDYAQSEYVQELNKRYLRTASRFKGRKDWCRKSLADRAKECGLLKLYQLLHRPFSSAVHGDIVGLSLSVERELWEDKGIITEWGPSTRHVGRTLHGAHICVLAALWVTNDVLDLKRGAEIDNLQEIYWNIWGNRKDSKLPKASS